MSGNDCATAFDHAYVIVSDLAPLAALNERGFAVPPWQVEHPGGALCRVLPFPCVQNQSFGRSFQYLEFVQVADRDRYVQHQQLARQRVGLAPRSADQLMQPGFSLVTHSADQLCQALPPELAAYRPVRDHVAYRWQHEPEPDRPGWTYLKFSEQMVPFCELWFTEYEPDPQNPNRGRPVIAPSPNTCAQILGCVWDIGPQPSALMDRVQLLCGGQRQPDALVLNHQFSIWTDPTSLDELGLPAASGGFAAMVLGCTSLVTFKRLAHPDRMVQWRGREAAVLQPYPNGWALVVIEQSA